MAGRQADRVTRPPAISLFILAVLLLFPAFYQNQWKTVDHDRFLAFQADSQSLAIGGLAHVRQTGLFAEPFLLGAYDRAAPDAVRRHGWNPSAWIERNRAAYFLEQYSEEWNPYKSRISWLHWLLAMVEVNVAAAPESKMTFYFASAAFLSAAVIASLSVWCLLEFNLVSAFLVLLSTLYSPWLIDIARNFYWQIWLEFLPLCVLLFVFYREQARTFLSHKNLFLITFALLFAKCLNSYEFITTVYIAAFLPLFYYALKNRWTFAFLAKRFAVMAAAGLLAFALTLSSHLWLRVIDSGSVEVAIEAQVQNFTKRISGYSEEYGGRFPGFNPAMGEDIGISRLNIVRVYLSKDAAITWENGYFTFGDLSLGFLFFSALALLIVRRSSRNHALSALVLMTWLGFLASLSWFILAKQHAYEHTHLDYLVWHLPYTLLGFALCGAVIGEAGRKLPIASGPRID